MNRIWFWFMEIMIISTEYDLDLRDSLATARKNYLS